VIQKLAESELVVQVLAGKVRRKHVIISHFIPIKSYVHRSRPVVIQSPVEPELVAQILGEVKRNHACNY